MKISRYTHNVRRKYIAINFVKIRAYAFTKIYGSTCKILLTRFAVLWRNVSEFSAAASCFPGAVLGFMRSQRRKTTNRSYCDHIYTAKFYFAEFSLFAESTVIAACDHSTGGIRCLAAARRARSAAVRFAFGVVGALGW